MPCSCQGVHYEITQHGNYLRGVIGDAADMQEFASFYRELQSRCMTLGIGRALVVVRPEQDMPGPDRLLMFERAGFVDGFKLALVCATWTLYQACNKAEMAANRAAVQVRAFVQEMEAVSWLTANS
jgi:hypothetical protein